MAQGSRKDLIKLLFRALYLDDHLSLAEDEVLGSALDSIGWESTEPRELCILGAFAKAREAAGCELKTSDFLTSRAERIKNAGEAAKSLTWLSKVLGADGISPGEDRYLKKLERIWFA